MKPEDIKALMLSLELYRKALEEAIVYNKLTEDKLKELFKDGNTSN